MISRPEDRPKAILLVVAIVAVLAFVVWNLRRALAGPDTPTQPVPVPLGNSMGLTPPTNIGAGPSQPNGGYYAQFQPSTSMSDPTKVDPFRSPLPKARNVDAFREPGISVSGGGGLQPVDPGTGMRPMDVQEIQSTIQLKGIVSGAGSPMAVLRIGETTYNVFAGERLTKELVVSRISATMVEILYFNQPFRLVIGQAKMANMAAPPLKKGPRALVAQPSANAQPPLEVVPLISELPPARNEARIRPAETHTPPAYVEPPSEPRPKPEPKQRPADVPATINPPRTEERPAAPTSSQPGKPSPEMGPI